jgi:hypothetical protein
MTSTELYPLDAAVVFRGKAMRVVGRLKLEGASGQATIRYLLSDGAGAPVLLEQAGDRFALLRAFPSAAEPETAGNTITVGTERYTLVGVRRLSLIETLGQVPGATPNTAMLLSGMFEGPTGTLMRELAPGSGKQLYYLVKTLVAGEMLSAAAHGEVQAAETRAAANRADD